MIKADSHIHTERSFDGEATLKQMADRAAELGLDEIAVTDHRDYKWDTGEDYACAIDFTEYVKNFQRARERTKKIRLTLGIEIGMMPAVGGVNEKLNALVAEHPFDFVIGSSHDCCGHSLYEGDFFDGKDKRAAYLDYFAEVLQNIKAVDFDVYGHLDYITRYARYEDNALDYIYYADVVDEILRELITRGKGLEINTSGYRYGLNTLHPQTAILKRYRELGGEIITVGSDAHSPRFIAEHFDLAETALKEAGFTAYAVFRQRKPEFMKL